MTDERWRTFKLPGCGLECGECGENLPRVYRVRRTPGFIIRERRCPNPKCGKLNVTSERVIQTRNTRPRRG